MSGTNGVTPSIADFQQRNEQLKNQRVHLETQLKKANAESKEKDQEITRLRAALDKAHKKVTATVQDRDNAVSKAKKLISQLHEDKLALEDQLLNLQKK